MENRIEAFPGIADLPGIRHGFTLRIPGVDVRADREQALERLDDVHSELRRELGAGKKTFVTARQVHGRKVAMVNEETFSPVPDADGLITASPGVCLGVYVADCCPVYLADPVRRVIALLHSGRKGSELGIAGEAIRQMRDEFGCDPAGLVVQLGPCIRPPHYEVDFAAQIAAQCREMGTRAVYDCRICTACHPERYYSYRLEKGKTGRMLALMTLDARE